MAVFDATNLDGEFGAAYELKEAFRAAMAIGRSGDTATFNSALELYDALCRGSGIAAFVSVAKTFTDWRTEIINYAASGGASNALPKPSSISSRTRSARRTVTAPGLGSGARSCGHSARWSTPTPARWWCSDRYPGAREPVISNP